MAWKIASLYIASVIGAGFASGQELVQFFARFGGLAYLGVGLTTLGLSLCGGQTLYKCVSWGLSDYNQLIRRLNNHLAPYFDLAYTAFLILGTAIMLAGTEIVIVEIAQISGGMYLTAFLVLIPLLIGPGGILKLNGYMVPVMILLIGYVAVSTIIEGKFMFPPGMVEAVPYGVLYAGYNYGFALAVFAGIGGGTSSSKSAKSGGWIGGLILGVLIALVITALFASPPAIMDAPIPMLALAQRMSPTMGKLYGLVIWMAMYTTALAHGLAVTQRLHRLVFSHWWKTAGLVLGVVLLIARLGFVPLLSFTYPIFGIVGLYLLYQVMRR